jgi:hypothetical protein
MLYYSRNLTYFYYSLYIRINVRRIQSNYKSTIDKFCLLIEDIKYNLHGFDRFNYRRRPGDNRENKVKNVLTVNYHFIGYVKKVILLLLVLLSHDYPKVALSLSISLFLGHFFLSICVRPFIFKWVGFLKSFTDFLDFVMMVLMLAA